MAAFRARPKRKRENETEIEGKGEVHAVSSFGSPRDSRVDRLCTGLRRLQAHLQSQVDACSKDKKVKRETLNALNAVHSVTGSLLNLVEDLMYHGGAKTIGSATSTTHDDLQGLGRLQNLNRGHSATLTDRFDLVKTEPPSLVLHSPPNRAPIPSVPVISVVSAVPVPVPGPPSSVPVGSGSVVSRTRSRSNPSLNPSTVLPTTQTALHATAIHQKATDSDPDPDADSDDREEHDTKHSGLSRTESSGQGWEEAFPKSLADATTDEEDNLLDDQDPDDSQTTTVHMASTHHIAETLTRLQNVLTHAFPSTKGVHFQEPDSADYH